MTYARLYKIALVVSLVGLVVSLASIAVSAEHKSAFAWFFLYLPFLWVLWIFCALFAEIRQNVYQLILVWTVIDISALAIYISFALGIENWVRSNGIDVVMFVSFFPFVIPASLSVGLLPESLRLAVLNKLDSIEIAFGNGVGGAVVIWMMLSVLAAIQSLILIAIAQYLSKRRRSRLLRS